MNKRLKNVLRTAFEAPQPLHKERFIKNLHYPKITYRSFLFSQFFYIRKRVWALSGVLVFIGWVAAFCSPMLGNWNAEAERIRTVSAVLPFLALLSAAEIYRSASYRMSELEMSFRFNLSQIIMARITILGGGNFAILTLLLIFIRRASPYSLLQVVNYLMVPYLITCGVCLLILNHVHRRESLYCCPAAACLACITNIVFSSTVQLFYSGLYLNYWLLLFISSGVFIGIQMRHLLKQTEDRTGNLFLTEWQNTMAIKLPATASLLLCTGVCTVFWGPTAQVKPR